LNRALQTFQEGRRQSHTFHNDQAESRALLGLGDIYHQQGQIGQAKNAYTDARVRIETLGEFAGAVGIAEAEVRLARLAIFTGDLKDADAHLTTTKEAMTRNPLAQQVSPLALIVQGQWLLTQGNFTQAEACFSEAYNQAEAQQEPLRAAEAILGLAQTRLAREEFDAALTTFLEAGRQFQSIESTDGDGGAVLGIAQVNLGREQWDETVENGQAALTRFRQTNDLIGEADTLLTLGMGFVGKDEQDEALSHFEQALKLYHQLRQPLGVADTRSARAGIYLLRGQVEQARDEEAKAITQVERVMESLSTSQQWSMFLRQYADLYAQTAITDIRRNQDKQAQALLQKFARIAGSAELARQLKAYEDALPEEENGLSAAEIRTNKDIVQRLEQLRKGLP
jgi:tetratricopeptide (TPR) repeat protein